jgi:hypothetical protein
MFAAFLLALFQEAYKVPAEFEPGASKQATRATGIRLRPRLLKAYAALASEGRSAEILLDDARWMPYVIDGLKSDDEKIARTSFQVLSDLCVKHKISASEESFKNPVKLELVNSAAYRAGEYAFWTEWWGKDRERAPVPQLPAPGGPARAKWDEIMICLRGGGAFDDPSRPEGMAFQKVKNMGEGAYPYLVSYIDNEDVMLGRAAVVVLNALTGRSAPLPNEATKALRKSEWDEWILAHPRTPAPVSGELLALLKCDVKEDKVRALVANLSDDDPAERRRAALALRPCAFRHEGLLRKCRAGSNDAETRVRLDEILAYLDSMGNALDGLADPEEPLMAGTPAAAIQEDFDRLAKKAALLREEGKSADALDHLKSARPRFRLTRWAAELQKRIEELDR